MDVDKNTNENVINSKVKKLLSEFQLSLYINHGSMLSMFYCDLMIKFDLDLSQDTELTKEHIEKCWKNVIYSGINPISYVNDVFSHGCSLMYKSNEDSFIEEMDIWNPGWRKLKRNDLPKIKETDKWICPGVKRNLY